MSNSCNVLTWDSAHFGFNIGKVEPGFLSELSHEELTDWSRQNDVCCLYLTCEISDKKSISYAEKNGFRLVDMRITLEKYLANLGDIEPINEIRYSTDADVPHLKAIAHSIYHDTRFYYDERFPKDKVDTLYETWIEKSHTGFADAVLVYDNGNSILGYISCHLKADSVGNIGLVGVAETAQGMKLGGKLVRSALAWFAEKGVIKATVVTQGRNLRAQRLYQREGFITSSIELIFHKWF